MIYYVYWGGGGILVYPSITNSFDDIGLSRNYSGYDFWETINVQGNGGSLEYFIEDDYGLASFDFSDHVTYSLNNEIHYNNYNEVPHSQSYTVYVYVKETNILNFKGKIGNNNIILYTSTIVLESPHKPISIYVYDQVGEPAGPDPEPIKPVIPVKN